MCEEATKNRTVVDQFVFTTKEFDVGTLSVASNLTGGQFHFYPPTGLQTNDSILSSLYEKMHYDLSRVLSRKNFYDVKFMFRFSSGIDCVEILGPFQKKLGEAFQLGGCDPDYCFYYNMRINENFKPKDRICVQIVCLYYDNYGKQFLRTFNSTYEMCQDVGAIFNNCDVDAMSKAIIYKELSLIYITNFERVKQNLNDKIVNFLMYLISKGKESFEENINFKAKVIKIYFLLI